MKDLIWYASYGSNLSQDRFLCYIKGGCPLGVSKDFAGCSDKSYPQGDTPIILPYELYFAKKSKTWNDKGVAFIKAARDDNAKTYGRKYLITKEQFVEVVRQENGYKPTDVSINIDFQKTIKEGISFIKPCWYGRIIFLGNENGYPIFTFSGKWEDDEITTNAPSSEYLRTIIGGIKERYSLNNDEIVKYFINIKGIQGIINEDKIREILKEIKIFGECKESVDNFESNKYPSLSASFGQKRKEAEEKGDKDLESYARILGGIFSMYFQFTHGKPFGPHAQWPNGSHTTLPEDLANIELDKLEKIVKISDNAQFNARIYDVLWIRRKEYLNAKKALKAYLQLVNENKDECWVSRSKWLKRATQIAMELGGKAQERDIVKAKLFELFEVSRKNCFNSKQDYWPASLLEILLKNKLIDDWEEFGDKAVEIAKGFSISAGCDAPRKYYKLAAQCYRYGNKPEKGRKAKLAIARHWEDEAKLFQTDQGCDGLNLAHRIEKAIHAYREVGETQKAEELVHKLKEANKIATSQMKVIKTPAIDADPLLKIADNIIGDKKGCKALEAFSFLLRPFNYDEERKTAEKNLKDHPLQGLFDVHILTEEGNVVAKVPGITDNHEEAIKAQIIKGYNLGQNLSAATTLKRGIYLILQSGNEWKNDLKEFLTSSNFVPQDRRDIYERAIISGFDGDYLVFAHLIVPQIENSIRMIFAKNKLKITSVTPDGIQQERDLNQLLTDSEAEKIFGKDLVWEMRSLLIEKYGPNFRNRICHGLISSEEVNSASSIFLLWLTLYLICGFKENY